MNIKDELLTVNDYSRPGKKILSVLGIVMHWTGVPNQPAEQVRQFFENRKTGMGGYGSAHYIVDMDGSIIRCIPDNEMAYHCGSSQKDPVSGQIYTDYARRKFGSFAKDPAHCSPNQVTIGIEMCPIDSDGNFTTETLKAAAELVKSLLEKTKLTVYDITTHHDIVGWKDCPRLWTNHPEKLNEFREMVITA